MDGARIVMPTQVDPRVSLLQTAKSWIAGLRRAVRHGRVRLSGG
jgi:hypothetical protein